MNPRNAGIAVLFTACVMIGVLSTSRAAPPSTRRPDGASPEDSFRAFTMSPRVAHEQLMQAEGEAKEAAVALRDTEAMVAELRNSIRSSTGRVDVSADGIRQAASKLEEQLQTLEIEEVGADARADAVQSALKEVSERAADKGGAASKELGEVVKARQQQLDRMLALHQAASVSASDVDVARAALAEAKARLAEQEWQVANAAGGDGLGTWNKELLNLKIAQAERRARLSFIKRRLDRLKAGLSALDELEHRQDLLRRAQRAVDEADDHLRAMRRMDQLIRLEKGDAQAEDEKPQSGTAEKDRKGQ